MPAKPNSRRWNDVQMAIATAAIVTTLGLWNLFSTPSKTNGTQTNEPVMPPMDSPFASMPTAMPQVKIMFTQTAPQTNIIQQVQDKLMKKKRNKNNSNGGSTSITQTRSS